MVLKCILADVMNEFINGSDDGEGGTGIEIQTPGDIIIPLVVIIFDIAPIAGIIGGGNFGYKYGSQHLTTSAMRLSFASYKMPYASLWAINRKKRRIYEVFRLAI